MSSPQPSPELRARVLAAAQAEPSPPRATGTGRHAIAVTLGVAASAALLLWVGGPGAYGRPPGYTTTLAVGWLAVGLVACWAGVMRGPSMLGRPASWRIAAAVLTPVVLLATALVAGLMFPSTLAQSTSFDQETSCSMLALLMALGPLLAFAYVRRGSDPVHPRLTAAALGAAAGSLGAFGVELRCSHASLLHVARAHLGPTVLVTLVAVLAATRLVGVRAPRTR